MKFLRWITLAYVGMCLFLNAHAASIDKLLAGKVQVLESRYEERARGILSAQMDPGTYLVTVKIEIDSEKIAAGIAKLKGTQLRTLSKRLSQDDLNEKFADIQTPETLTSFIKRVHLKLALDKQIEESLVKIVVSAIKETLALQDGRDVVNIVRDKLGGATTAKQQEKISQLEIDKNRTIEEKRSLEIKLGSIETQRLQYEDMVRQARAETERVKGEHSLAKEEIKKLKDQISDLEQNALGEKTFLGKIRKNIKGFELLVTLFPVALVALIGIGILTLIYISSQGRRSKTMFEGMQILAGALQKGGGSQQNQAALNNMTARAAVARENAASSDSASQMVSDGAFELVKREAEESWELLKNKPYFLLAILKDLCATAEGASRFIAFCDVIGFANAKEIWGQLTPQDIENATRMAGIEPISKNIALAVVPQIVKQVEAQYAIRPSYFRNLDLNFLASSDDLSLASKIEKLQPELAAFLFYALTAERAGRILNLLKGAPHVDVEVYFEKMATLESLNEVDAEKYVLALRDTIGRERPKAKVSGHMLSLFETADPEQKNKIAKVLKGNATFSAEIGNRLVTIEDVFGLDASTLGELIASLDVQQLSELVFSLPANAQQKVSSLLTQKMIFDVQQEIARFRDKPAAARKAQANGFRLQEMLCEAVRAQVEQGLIVLANAPGNERAS